MPNLANNHTGIPFPQITIQRALADIKTAYELSIVNRNKANTIRASKLIKLIHCAVKTEFLNNNVHPSLINPDKTRLNRVVNPPKKTLNKAIRLEDKELTLCGFLKPKKQDISIVPRNIVISPEILNFPTYLKGYNDVYGSAFTNSVLSVNVRSQLSSLGKNFDTLYERTFAEALNFHLRFPHMVLGEVYLIPVKEYDADEAEAGNIVFKNVNVEKYINAFQAINSRVDNDADYKYERCCLLLVDFNREEPKIYNTTRELIDGGYLPNNSTATMNNLNYESFVQDILAIYANRFPANSFN